MVLVLQDMTNVTIYRFLTPKKASSRWVMTYVDAFDLGFWASFLSDSFHHFRKASFWGLTGLHSDWDPFLRLGQRFHSTWHVYTYSIYDVIMHIYIYICVFLFYVCDESKGERTTFITRLCWARTAQKSRHRPIGLVAEPSPWSLWFGLVKWLGSSCGFSHLVYSG